jgi:hypothetical protein
MFSSGILATTSATPQVSFYHDEDGATPSDPKGFIPSAIGAIDMERGVCYYMLTD